MSNFAQGQYGPVALEDINGRPLVGATVQVPNGYTATVINANLTITGPPADGVAFTPTFQGVQQPTQTVTVLPLSADVVALNGIAVPKWQPATAYVLGQTVLNPTGELVNALAAFTSGATFSAANWSPPSSGTYARRRARWAEGNILNVPLVAATPVTKTTTAVTAGTILTTSTIANVVHTEPNVPGAFTYLGAHMVTGNSIAGQSTSLIPYGGSTGPQQSAAPFVVEFTLDTVNGTIDLIVQNDNNGELRVAIDGQYQTAGRTFVAPGTNQVGVLHTFSGLSAGRHFFRVEVNAYARWGGVNIGPTDQVIGSPARRERWIVVGDSWTEPTINDTTTGIFYGSGYVQRLAQILNVDAWSSGSGGTGYLNPGGSSRTTFRPRLAADVIPYAPDVVVWAGGINDYAGYSAAAIVTEAKLAWAAIAAALPNALQIVLSPFPTVGLASVPAGMSALNTALAAAAASVGLPYVDLINLPLVNYSGGTVPSGSSWVTGTGTQLAPAGGGTADRYINTGHPTSAGHRALADSVADALAATQRAIN